MGYAFLSPPFYGTHTHGARKGSPQHTSICESHFPELGLQHLTRQLTQLEPQNNHPTNKNIQEQWAFVQILIVWFQYISNPYPSLCPSNTKNGMCLMDTINCRGSNKRRDPPPRSLDAHSQERSAVSQLQCTLRLRNLPFVELDIRLTFVSIFYPSALCIG